LPDTGRDLCSQPTVSRWENAPSLREAIRLMRATVDLLCQLPRPPAAVTLDIDDMVDAVHGRQQLSLFNAPCDERCFLPIHIYDTAASRPVMVLLLGLPLLAATGSHALALAEAAYRAGSLVFGGGQVVRRCWSGSSCRGAGSRPTPSSPATAWRRRSRAALHLRRLPPRCAELLA
jgi:hypothetical protein